MALNELLHEMRELSDMTPFSVAVDAGIYAYDPVANTILLDHNHPSIVSTLHEFWHSVIGESELEACRFSVWLFKETFPKSYEELKWKGHMLIL
jgi:hypothetical protein